MDFLTDAAPEETKQLFKNTKTTLEVINLDPKLIKLLINIKNEKFLGI